jgi:hypothetical protein
MSLIPNYGGAIPKQYRSSSVGDIQELGIKKLFRLVILGPSYSGNNNRVLYPQACTACVLASTYHC